MTYIYITTFGNGANGINGSTGTNSTFTVLAAIENDHGHDHLTLIKFARLALRSLVLSGAGRVLMWHEVKGTWNVNKACSMYSGPLKRSLVKIYGPKKRKYTVMEDNDPSGSKSRKAIDCKAASRLTVLPLPRRSPDLNPLDYAIWAAINKRMRKQESSWPALKRETRKQFLCRLRRTAMSLPSTFIDNVLGNLEVRCQKLIKAKGGHFAKGR